ncbi:PAS domain S-box protein [Balneolaceae bacterium YR4-1]|uniref:Oxygen sensor histidine kinase NreB n=1 Tax=Halalkalibaculum roseum TaxID=2709311 RepID=A0A6M1STB2_9BACT|nr:PAS domain S-box protein [Halalkalibaculum roseum]NGP75348.1 PAS domain S-box protein [Halalkalibaculum roseum]
MKDKYEQLRTLSPLSIALIYFLAAGLWIILTDYTLTAVFKNSPLVNQFQTYKGMLFVGLTSVGLYFLISKYSEFLLDQGERLKGVRSELKSDRKLIDILFEKIPVFITIYDPNYEKFEVNREFEKVTGWTNQDARTLNLFEACFPDQEIREDVAEFMENPGMGWKDFPLKTKSGKKLETSWTNIKLTDNTSVGIGIDMTETKASQNRLKSSQELLNNVFESLEESVILVEPNTRIIRDCNKAAEKIFGYKKDELIGHSTRFLHVDEAHYQQFEELGKEALDQHGTFKTEFKLKKKNGEIFYSEHTVTLVYDKQGEVDRVVSVVRDITDRKNFEKELKHRQKRLLRSQRIGKIGDWEFIPSQDKINWSPMMYRIFEKDSASFQPSFDDIKAMYIGDDYEKHQKVIQNAIETGESFDVDLKLKTGKGNYKIIRAIGQTERQDEGKVEKLVGTVQDITERKRFEEALQENERRLKNITNNIPGVVFQYKITPDGSDGLQYVSDGSERIWGVSAEKAIKNNDAIWDRIHDSDIDLVKKSIQKSAENLSRWDEEWRYVKPDGSERWQHGIGIPRVEEDGSILWDSVIFDITERKRLREQVFQSVIEGEDRERKRIARELHDGIGQYLTAANMNLEAIKKDVKKLPEKRENQFVKGLSLLNESINEIRSISQNLMPKAIEDYGLVRAVEALIESFRDSTEIVFYFNSKIHEEELGERRKVNIYRIIQEAVQNAVKHSECSNVSIQLYQENEMIYLTVEDNGKGISSPNKGVGENHHGNGLGIKSMRSRAKALSASLVLDSAPGKGSVISLGIPLTDN